MRTCGILIILIICASAFAEDKDVCESKGLYEILSDSGDIDKIKQHIEKCDEVTKLVKSLEGVDKGEVVLTHPNSSKLTHRVLKLFTSKGTDQWVNLYAQCSDEGKQENFLKNIIMLEAYNACIFPNPPGVLSSKDSEQLAELIAGRYGHLGLVQLSKNSTEILNTSYSLFIKKVLKESFKDMVAEPYIDSYLKYSLALQKVHQLPSKKKQSRYRDHMMINDVMIEAFESLGHLAVKKQIIHAMPQDISEEEKMKTYDNEFSLGVRDLINKCISDAKERTFYSEQNINKRFRQLKKSQQQYCDKFDCSNEDPCESSISLMSNRDDISDTDYLLGCAINSIDNQLEGIVAITLDHELKSMGLEDSKPETLAAYTKQGTAILKNCLTEETKTTDNIEENTYILAKLGADKYEAALEKCKGVTEWAMGRVIVEKEVMHLTNNEESVKESIEVFNRCQNKVKEKGPTACLELVEMYAAYPAMRDEINKATNQKESIYEKSLKQCIQSKEEYFYEDQDADLRFYEDCFAPFITESITDDAKKQFIEVIQSEKLKDPNYAIDKITPKVGIKARKCINDKLNEMDWKAFKVRATDGTLEEHLNTCKLPIEAFALSHVVDNEIGKEFQSLVDEGIIDNNDVKAIRLGLAKKLDGHKYPRLAIENSRLRWSGNTSEFINHIQIIATDVATKKIHKKIMNEVAKQYGSSILLEDALDPQCFLKLSSKTPSQSGEKTGYKEIATIFGGSYKRALNLGRGKEFLDNIKEMCSDDKVKYLDDAIAKGYLDEVIKEEIHNSLWAELEPELLKLQVAKDDLSKFDTRFNEAIRLIIKHFKNNPKHIDKVFSENPDLIEYVKNNYASMKDPKIKEELTNKLLTAIFNNTDSNGFATLLIREIIIQNVGNEGKKDVEKGIDDTVQDYGRVMKWIVEDRVEEYTPDNIAKFWVPGVLSKQLDWENTDAKHRAPIHKSFLENAILNNNREKLTEDITGYLEKKTTPQNNSFKDRYTELFKSGLTKDVTKDILLDLIGL
jgi:hypothetical protein